MTNAERRMRIRRALPSALAVTAWLLAGCAPGSGGTGLPAAAGADGTSAASSPSASTPTSTPTPTPAPATAPAPATLPSTAPLLEGVIDAVDAATVVVAGSGFTRSALRIVIANGTDAPAAAIVVGARLRIWTVNGGHLALLLQ